MKRRKANTMNRCSRCVTPDTDPFTLLRSDGTCNHCAYWDRVGPFLGDFDRLERLFAQKLDRVRGKFKYDVMVGLSGGKDGSYVLSALMRKYDAW